MITLDELRESLTDQQREFLSRIWAYYQENRKWIRTSLLHSLCGGKDVVRPALEELGGSIVCEYEEGRHRLYGLTILGVLLAERGAEWQALIAAYLHYAAELFKVEPQRTHIGSHEVMAALNLDADQTLMLRRLIELNNFYISGNPGSQGWAVEVPEDIEDLPENLERYVAERALSRYDPHTPLSPEERLAYFYSTASKPAISEFAFVADPVLRQQLESDWREVSVTRKGQAWKACLILCGGIIEGMLLDVLRLQEAAALAALERLDKGRKPLVQWDLVALVDAAHELHIVGEEAAHLGHALRGFRNLIHPGRQLRENLHVTEGEADIAFNSVRRFMREIQDFATQRGESSHS